MSNFSEYDFTFHADGSVRAIGTDFGGRLTVQHEDATYLVLFVRGHKRWHGNGRPWVYEPAAFYVFRKLREAKGGEHPEEVRLVTCERVVSFPIKKGTTNIVGWGLRKTRSSG